MTVAAAEPESKPASSKRSIVLSVAFLVLVAVVVWAFDGLLLFKLRMIANDAYADRKYPMLTVDAVNELNEYSPKRLARFLSIPSTQVRTVASMAIAMRRLDPDPKAWIGVAPALLRFYRDSEEGYARARVAHTVALLPLVPREDVEAVFAYAEEEIAAAKPEWTVVASVLETIAVAHPELKQRVLETLVRALPKTTDLERKDAFTRIMRFAKDSPEAVEALRWACHDGMLGYLRPELESSLVRRNPGLIDELLEGTRTQRLSVLSMASHDLQWQGAVTKDSKERTALWTPTRIDAVRRKAIPFLDPKSKLEGDSEIDAAFGVVSTFPDGATLLMDAAKKSPGKRRARALYMAHSSANRLGLPEGERILTPYLPLVLTWLLEDDADVMYAARSWFYGNFPERAWFKAQSTGPDSPIVVAFRKLLDKDKGNHEYACLTVLEKSGPEIDPRDVDRISAALERALMMMKTNLERTGVRPQGSIDVVHERLFERLKKQADRPATKKVLALRQQLLDEGIVTKPRTK
jgi:hypothetical protein